MKKNKFLEEQFDSYFEKAEKPENCDLTRAKQAVSAAKEERPKKKIRKGVLISVLSSCATAVFALVISLAILLPGFAKNSMGGGLAGSMPGDMENGAMGDVTNSGFITYFALSSAEKNEISYAEVSSRYASSMGKILTVEESAGASYSVYSYLREEALVEMTTAIEGGTAHVYTDLTMGALCPEEFEIYCDMPLKEGYRMQKIGDVYRFYWQDGAVHFAEITSSLQENAENFVKKLIF